jgi:hypothetical protein
LADSTLPVSAGRVIGNLKNPLVWFPR